PGIVHRLDRDTSGILVVAKNDLAHHGLAAQFKAKSAHRIYWALAHGTPRAKENTVRSLLARHPADRKRFASNAKTGKTAITHFRALRANRGVSWIECRLETGRTHQIRVHLSEAGLPILGDPLYGSKARDRQLNVEVPRLALHARELGFAHPRTGESMRFEIGWPEELETLARGLGLKDV
nr:RluA family pseudouridine synthase [Bdellovibrionales bacterium]